MRYTCDLPDYGERAWCRLEGYIFSTIALVLNYPALEMYVATPNTQHLRKVPVTPQHSRRQIQRGHTATGALTAPTPSQVQPFLGERSTPSSGQLTAESDRKLIRQLEEAIGGTRGLAVVARTLAMSHEKDGEAGLLLGAQQVSASPLAPDAESNPNPRPGLHTTARRCAHERPRRPDLEASRQASRRCDGAEQRRAERQARVHAAEVDASRALVERLRRGRDVPAHARAHAGDARAGGARVRGTRAFTMHTECTRAVPTPRAVCCGLVVAPHPSIPPRGSTRPSATPASAPSPPRSVHARARSHRSATSASTLRNAPTKAPRK